MDGSGWEAAHELQAENAVLVAALRDMRLLFPILTTHVPWGRIPVVRELRDRLDTLLAKYPEG